MRFLKKGFLIKQTSVITKMDFSVVQQDLEEVPDGEVYFIFRKNKATKCKIGRSDNPKQRASQLQTGNHRTLYVYKTLKGYIRLEKMLHKYFKEFRINGEWFDITFADVDEVIEQYNETKEENEQISEDELENEFDIEKMDNILDDETIELIEGTGAIVEVTEETTTKKIYRMKVIGDIKCEKCGNGFTKERYLKQHQNKRIPCDKVHKCTKCDTVFDSAYILRKHMSRKTPCIPVTIPVVLINNEENICSFCNKTYSSRSNLNKHRKNCGVASGPQAMQQIMNMVANLTQEVRDLKELQNKK